MPGLINGKTKRHLEQHKVGYLISLLPLLAAMATVMSYLHLNFARASDVDRIEKKMDMQTALLIKREIRSVKRMLHNDPENTYLQEDLEKLIDKLCYLQSTDRECD